MTFEKTPQISQADLLREVKFIKDAVSGSKNPRLTDAMKAQFVQALDRSLGNIDAGLAKRNGLGNEVVSVTVRTIADETKDQALLHQYRDAFVHMFSGVPGGIYSL